MDSRRGEGAPRPPRSVEPSQALYSGGEGAGLGSWRAWEGGEFGSKRAATSACSTSGLRAFGRRGARGGRRALNL